MSAFVSRFEAVFLCEHSKGPKMSQSSAPKYTGKSTSFIHKQVQRNKEIKTVDDLPGRSKTQKFTKEEVKQIVNMFSENPELSLRRGQAKLKEKGLNIGHDTIRRYLCANGIKYDTTWQSEVKKSLLSKKHVNTRFVWANENIDRDWSNVIFTDVTSFSTRVILQSSCTRTNEIVQRTVKRAKVYVWGCFSEKGFGTLYLSTHALNAEKMLKIYKKALLSTAKYWYIKKNEDWILQEDNNLKNQSKLCTKWKERSGIDQLDWPSQLPNVNPIKNVWTYIKHKLREKQIFSVEQLFREIRQIWGSLPHEYAVNLVQSMPSRCRAIINAAGDWTLIHH